MKEWSGLERETEEVGVLLWDEIVVDEDLAIGARKGKEVLIVGMPV